MTIIYQLYKDDPSIQYNLKIWPFKTKQAQISTLDILILLILFPNQKSTTLCTSLFQLATNTWTDNMNDNNFLVNKLAKEILENIMIDSKVNGLLIHDITTTI